MDYRIEKLDAFKVGVSKKRHCKDFVADFFKFFLYVELRFGNFEIVTF